jgi:hypothetical protein
MSDSLIAAQPRRLDASNPTPFSNASVPNSSIGIVRWCHWPSRSVNLTSTNSTPCSAANFSAASALIDPPAKMSGKLQFVVTALRVNRHVNLSTTN